MSAVTVAVHWWARSETPQEQAERWLVLLARLTELSDGELTEWRWDVDGDGPGPLVPRSAGEFATALQAANTHDDVDVIGWTAHVVGRRQDGGYVQVWISAGGTNEHSPFFVIVKLFPGPGASASPLADRLAETLAALAGTWDPDTGLAYDRELFKTVKATYGLPAPAPRCGWSVYLSENRAARVPGDFTARRLPTEHGGLVLDLAASPGETPATETVLAAHRALAESGALEPMPVPATGAKL